jgi:transposase
LFLMVDLNSNRPIDLLPDREAATVSQWLAERPSIMVVCRDRAGAYAEAATTGAPQAIQVADRWHLWHNLSQHVEKSVTRHRRCFTQPPPEATVAVADAESAEAAVPDEPLVAHEPDTGLAARTNDRHRAVHELLAAGQTLREICRKLNLSRGTVRRFARAEDVEELLRGQRHSSRISALDPFVEHLRQRWADGVTNASALWKEIRAFGYTGASTKVRSYVRPWRTGQTSDPGPTPPKALTTRHVTGLLVRDPNTLDTDEQQQRAAVLHACPDLERLAGHVGRFAVILTGLHGNKLDAWLDAVEADDLPPLHSFAAGVRRDYDGVRNGLTLIHNSGPVEGHVNRLKMLKRQMYGRANLDLLRKRVLLA